MIVDLLWDPSLEGKR